MSGRAKPDRFGGLQRPGPSPNVEIAALPAERRQLTVVFVDIVGSTPLSEQIDPEEFFAVIRTYRDICNEQISQYGGHIARMIGDGARFLSTAGYSFPGALRLLCGRLGKAGSSVSQPILCSSQISTVGG